MVLHKTKTKVLNAMIWDRVPKSRYVSFSQLELGVYDAAANFNIGRKASMLIFEKLNMVPGKYSLKGCQVINKNDYSHRHIKTMIAQKDAERSDVVKQRVKMIKMSKKKVMKLGDFDTFKY